MFAKMVLPLKRGSHFYLIPNIAGTLLEPTLSCPPSSVLSVPPLHLCPRVYEYGRVDTEGVRPVVNSKVNSMDDVWSYGNSFL